MQLNTWIWYRKISRDLACLFVVTINSLATVNHMRIDGVLASTHKKEKEKQKGKKKKEKKDNRDHTLPHIGPSFLVFFGASDSSVSSRAFIKRLTRHAVVMPATALEPAKAGASSTTHKCRWGTEKEKAKVASRMSRTRTCSAASGGSGGVGKDHAARR